jgi:hypothetical protein
MFRDERREKTSEREMQRARRATNDRFNRVTGKLFASGGRFGNAPV